MHEVKINPKSNKEYSFANVGQRRKPVDIHAVAAEQMSNILTWEN